MKGLRTLPLLTGQRGVAAIEFALVFVFILLPLLIGIIEFSVAYYIYALIFLAFDVDVLYLFPVALAYDKGYVIRDFIEIVIFIGILSLAIVYAWRKGVFTWQRRS